MNRFQHSGDLGDVLAMLPIIRQLGGGDVILSPHFGSGAPREPMTESRARFLMPVISSQPYVGTVSFETSPNNITHDFSVFRAKCHYQRGELLTHWQARSLGIHPQTIDMSPWLHVAPSPKTRGLVVIARSARYHNPRFQWPVVMRKYKDKAVFIGLPDEHAAFERTHGTVVYHKVTDSLEMASLIAGSQTFIGNQSFPCWIAMGLGHPLIQETFIPCLNSRVHRPNAKFVLHNFVGSL